MAAINRDSVQLSCDEYRRLLATIATINSESVQLSRDEYRRLLATIDVLTQKLREAPNRVSQRSMRVPTPSLIDVAQPC